MRTSLEARLLIISTSLLLAATLSLDRAAGQTVEKAPASPNIQHFVKLDGAAKVQEFFSRRPHGFLRRSTPAEIFSEQELIITTEDRQINEALAAATKRQSENDAKLAIFLLCQRARFVPTADFPVKDIEGYQYSPYGREGLIDPFEADLVRLGFHGKSAIEEAQRSANEKIRSTANLYCGEFFRTLAAKDVEQLVREWRVQLGTLKHPIYVREDTTEDGERARLLTAALVSKGQAAAVAIAALLKSEQKPWARYLECQTIGLIDEATVRLRATEEGREVIGTVKEQLATRDFGPLKTISMREEYWRTLNAQFFYDQHVTMSYSHVARLISLAFDQHFHENSLKHDPPLMVNFVGFMTTRDANFPSWEFASTLSTADMFHPKFKEKMRRYHQEWERFVHRK